MGTLGEIRLHIERHVAVDVDAGPLQQLRQGQIEQSEQIGRDGGGADNALGLLLQLNTVHHVFCVLSLLRSVPQDIYIGVYFII